VNAQERTREKTIESLRIGAQEMLETHIPLEADATMVAIEVSGPAWMLDSAVAP
jgi:hypothetical protein